MYDILNRFLEPNQIAVAGILVAFVLTFAGLAFPFRFLPVDHGREFAVNGALSKGKTRGAGFIFVIVFIICSLLFMPVNREYIIYCILLLAVMLSGYLDDASRTPWNEYKKGLIDLVISVVAMWTFTNYNKELLAVHIGKFVLDIPVPVYFILGIILIWVSINVTNCNDGVDGLCASLCCVVISSFTIIYSNELGNYVITGFIFVSVLLAYLYFNSAPSSMLMGDAGSRALGFYIALLAMKTGHPVSYILLALVLIVDGGIGLIKVALKRFLKISILVNTRTPLHDHARKNKGWSDTQVVFRFVIFQIICALIAYIISI
ncbi:MAG: phospho-N-acetylmuramoyl-pentapeptide-transferase [Lachnospiraceae bacterium]|nr:phospho-N-acetylmuramoyl-pentapeptide-transferase [Lachnospiraceae bacterium]